MPKAPKTTPAARASTRRSSRLSKKGLKDVNAVEVGAPSKPKRKTAVNDTNAPLCANDASTSVAKPHATSDLRRSLRITPAELIRREKALLKEEQDCKRREIELDERASLLLKKEAEASLVLSQIPEREAEAALAQLEEHFTCALCYEIMAHPYTLNPGQCGHTFCAICILKWFFSRLHMHCGAWHESVDCPICRSLLVITPDRVPRPDTTFPFVPNRTAAAVCETLIEKLRNAPSGALIVKREDSEGAWGWPSGCSRKKDASKDADEKKVEENADVASWREGGFMRTEWLKKDRDGKREMNRILKDWSMLTSQDFRNLKQKLGV
ncbi:putative RING-type zinc-finger [Lyophyllum shimeji]|uniref:RING-type zinc-finger n=1 Tax=Lyophyllum shimeji TaxID=47721 RepID=A0A9P3UR23_LYOSH|nr:putative RING-type zinc-finger [Lyophyllum shimeji]